MRRKFLRSTCATLNQAVFTRTIYEWDLDAHQALPPRTSSEFACAAFELNNGALIDQWCRPDGTRVTAYYRAGSIPDPDRIRLVEEANHADCPVAPPVAQLSVTLAQATAPAPNTTASGVLLFDYVATNAPVQAVLTGDPAGPRTATGAGTTGQLSFGGPIPDGLIEGYYELLLEDATGAQTRLPNVPLGVTPVPYWLTYLWAHVEDDSGVYLFDPYDAPQGTYYDRATRTVLFAAATEQLPTTGYRPYPFSYSRPTTDLVDEYPLPDGRTYRRAYHDGTGGLSFVNTVLPNTPADPLSTLHFSNITTQHIHRVAELADEQTGSVLLEALSASAAPLTYTRLDTLETNAHGRFGSLAAGTYRFRAQDTDGQSVEEDVVIEDRYRLRFFLDSWAGTRPLRVDILGRDYDGPATQVQGTAEPVMRRWDTAGASLDGVLPEAAGQSCTLQLVSATRQQFTPLQVAADDRLHRVDVSISGQLVFRGYVLPDLYEQDLRSATGGVITITAADGLGTLRDTAFLNHISQPLTGRWPVLSTLLLCLSKCECGPLPLYVQTGLREVLLAEDADWLPAIFSDRAFYREDKEGGNEWDCRAVVEALLRPAQATLLQRNGAWWVASANAAADAETYFTYAPNGEPLPAVPAPLVRQLKPATFTTGQLHWVEAAQRQQTLAAARAVQVSTKLVLVENHFADATLQAWQPDGSAPLGWSGDLSISRLDHDTEAGQTKLRIEARQTPGAALRSPAIPHRNNFDETPVRVTLRVRVPVFPTLPGQAVDVAVVVGLQALVDGVVVYPDLRWEVNSKEKEVTLDGFLPLGGYGNRLQIELLAPRPAVAGTNPLVAIVDVYEISLQILPGAVEWPDSDQITGLNDSGFYVLPPVELAHTDTPRLPLSDGTVRPAPLMDAFAWRHVLTYADGAPSTAWVRPYSFDALPLLESAATDRLDLRRAPIAVLTGPVMGSAAWEMGWGSVVDVPQDAPSRRFWVVGCESNDIAGQVALTLREIGTAAPEPYPLNRLITHGRTPLITDEGYTLVWR